MKRFLLSAALLLACSGVALAQESEFSGGGGGGITTAGGSGTAGVIPAFVSASSLEDSKMTTSGGSKGTWTLYDNGGTGVTSLVLQAGTNQSTTDYLLFADSAGANTAGIRRTADNVLNITDGAGGLGRLRVEGVNLDATATVGFFGGSGEIVVYSGLVSQTRFKFSVDKFIAASDAGFQFTNTAADPGATVDLGMSRSAAGILAVTDGSTGQGGIGIADAATNTVSDALILRHQGGTVAGNGFGTGLKFQGENDAGTMHDMASIDAVWSLDDDTNEQSQFKFSTYDVGGELPILTLYKSGGETKLDAPYNMDLIAGNVLALYGATQLTFVTNAANKWIIPSTGAFYPATTNTYDIGTSSALVKDSYLGTSIQGVRAEVIPSDNVAENFVQISSATENAVTAGYIEYTVTAVDTTNEIIQTETGVVPFVAVNENTTVTSTLGTPYGVHQDNAGGAALAVSFAAVVTGTNVMMTVTSNYDQATLTGTVVNTLRYRVVLTSGTATVTPQT